MEEGQEDWTCRKTEVAIMKAVESNKIVIALTAWFQMSELQLL